MDKRAPAADHKLSFKGGAWHARSRWAIHIFSSTSRARNTCRTARCCGERPTHPAAARRTGLRPFQLQAGLFHAERAGPGDLLRSPRPRPQRRRAGRADEPRAMGPTTPPSSAACWGSRTPSSIGLSFGGFVAQALATRHPTLSPKVILGQHRAADPARHELCGVRATRRRGAAQDRRGLLDQPRRPGGARGLSDQGPAAIFAHRRRTRPALPAPSSSSNLSMHSSVLAAKGRRSISAKTSRAARANSWCSPENTIRSRRPRRPRPSRTPCRRRSCVSSRSTIPATAFSGDSPRGPPSPKSSASSCPETETHVTSPADLEDFKRAVEAACETFAAKLRPWRHGSAGARLLHRRRLDDRTRCAAPEGAGRVAGRADRDQGFGRRQGDIDAGRSAVRRRSRLRDRQRRAVRGGRSGAPARCAMWWCGARPAAAGRRRSTCSARERSRRKRWPTWTISASTTCSRVSARGRSRPWTTWSTC